MLAKTNSFGLKGIDGFHVEIEVNIVKANDFRLDIVGLADTAVKESSERIKSAFLNTGLYFPKSKITINLAPADKKKEGPTFDLPIAIAILKASKQLPEDVACDYVIMGELSLSGKVNKVNGLLPLLISAMKKGFKKFIVPKENSIEASFIEGIEVYAVENLKEVYQFLNGKSNIKPITPKKYNDFSITQQKPTNDFKDIKGQISAKRALEIAAAGGHNVLMIGPPGTGKTMLAKAFASILPEMSFEEALEVTKIHSVAGELDLSKGIICERPVRTPHHTASTPSMTGGGRNSKPGEISLAHNGVLFLDEMLEYNRHTLETMRQPLEDGTITIARVNQTITYPAKFILVASMNPCPCGYYGSKIGRKCTCSASQIHKYLGKLSGPLVDRIDIHVEVDNITYDEITSNVEAESSVEIRKRVNNARKIQRERFNNTKKYCNGEMDSSLTRQYCVLNDECNTLIKNVFEAYNMSARAFDKVLKVARTIADLDNSDDIKIQHLAEAIQFRMLDQKFWI